MIIPSSSSSSPKSVTATSNRGAFVLLEGIDRCGKTTQCNLLLKHLMGIGMAAVAMRFPDRTTAVGQLIDGYLASNQQLDDHAIHLLFSANRWEAAPKLKNCLKEGQTVICDRYAYSGVAFTSAKNNKQLSIEWCKAPDVGLPAPDVVIFLDISQNEAEQRGGYGGERYEKRDMQLRVRQQFSELQAMDESQGCVPWHVVNAAQSIEEVQNDVNRIVNNTLKQVSKGKPLYQMWSDKQVELEKEVVEEKNEKEEL